jgi:xanthine dehydrogenase accessory factor
MPQFYQQLLEALSGGEPFALGILSDIKGSSPQKRGAKALFFADGRIIGTLGGGCLEAEVQDRARRALRTGEASTFDLILDHDFGWDDGLICGGRVTGLILPRAAEAAALWREVALRREPLVWGVTDDYTIRRVEEAPFEELSAGSKSATRWLYQETSLPPCALWIAGSGHVAQAVAPMALALDFEVTVFDDRPMLANHRFFPAATRFQVGAWEELLQGPALPARPCFGLVVTRGHQRDALVLSRWIHLPFAFLGMIGSRRKARLILEQFVEDRLATPEQVKGVACPVGLDIESRTVPEIAVSILAQYIQKRAATLRTWEKAVERNVDVGVEAGEAGLEITDEQLGSTARRR